MGCELEEDDRATPQFANCGPLAGESQQVALRHSLQTVNLKVWREGVLAEAIGERRRESRALPRATGLRRLHPRLRALLLPSPP